MDQQACILVVDDDADIVNAVRLYLEKEGFCGYGASDGFEALAVLEQRTVHLILMDVMMPRMDGFSAIPVSYTHLDVYKRQASGRAFRCASAR